jgi:transposase-like protein
VVLEAVRLYVQGLSSYRILAALLEERLGRPVSRSTLNAWVDEIGSKAKTALEVSAELAPAWGGFLGVDGKSIWVAGEEACLLVGVDHPTQDIVHALVAGKEGGEEFAQLVTEAVLDAGYPLKGLVTDYGPGFVAAHHDHFSIVPLQLCRVHLDRRLDQAIPKAKRTDRAAVNAELKERVRSVLYAHSYEEACRRFYALFDERNRFAGAGPWDTIGWLHSHFGLYTSHHLTPALPADTNVVENVIKQLGKKLRLMEGFSSLGSAERFCRLLVACYRFKRFTDSCRVEGNGRTPLEAAGVDLGSRDWLSFLLDRKSRRTHST